MLKAHNADADEVRTSVASVVSSSRGTRIFLRLVGLAALLIAPTGRAETLVVIVNRSVGVQQLSRREALDIFLGRYRTFPSGASALPIDLDIKSEERREFYLMLAHKDSPDMNSYWARVTFTGKISPPFAVANARMAVAFGVAGGRAHGHSASAAACVGGPPCVTELYTRCIGPPG